MSKAEGLSRSAVEALKELANVRREYEAARQVLDQATRNLIMVERRVALVEWLQQQDSKGE